jgi:hypothetical protein
MPGVSPASLQRRQRPPSRRFLTPPPLLLFAAAAAGPVHPFVSVDLCPWDRAELAEWQEALGRACKQWRGDAAAALAAGGPAAEQLEDLAEECEQYLWGGAR